MLLWRKKNYLYSKNWAFQVLRRRVSLYPWFCFIPQLYCKIHCRYDSLSYPPTRNNVSCLLYWPVVREIWVLCTLSS